MKKLKYMLSVFLVGFLFEFFHLCSAFRNDIDYHISEFKGKIIVIYYKIKTRCNK